MCAAGGHIHIHAVHVHMHWLRGALWVLQVIRGMEWAISHAAQSPSTPAVFSLSIGGGPSATEDAFVAAAHEAGVTVVVAAGNSADDACDYSPGRAPTAINVGATTAEDSFASYSCHGPCVDIMAPGTGVLSSSSISDTATAVLSGTSMAAPHVAGAAAQLRVRVGVRPCWSGLECGRVRVVRVVRVAAWRILQGRRCRAAPGRHDGADLT